MAAISSSLDNIDGFYFEKAKLVWSARDDTAKIWQFLKKKDASAIKIIEKFKLQEQIPIFDNLNTFANNFIVRPTGSRRSFYINLPSGGVIAVKGTEVRSSSLKKALDEDSLNKLPHRPWTKFENFIYREQKLPLALFLNEALEENLASADFQTKMLRTFGEFGSAPIPLFVYEWRQQTIDDYFSKIKPYLNERTKNLAIPILKEFSLGVSMYYYDHLPYRIRFIYPKEVSDYNSRLQSILQNTNSEKTFDPLKGVEKLLGVVTKMLMLGYFPLSYQAHGIGQCIAPQNVTIYGGLTDMGSLFPFKKIKNDKEFYELFFSTIVVLCQTLKEFFVHPLPVLKYEFEDPSTLSVLLSNYIWDQIRLNFKKLSKITNTKVDSRLADLLSQSNNGIKLTDILKKIYPTKK